jgi:glycosyltransferase involved in cell wall biosynthesis
MSVSVCMATYNGEKYIREQISSILTQLKDGDEIIVSDDFSKDKTVEIIRSFNDPRIKLIENTVQAGVIKNFEKALSVVKGDYIFLSDQDDKWQANKVETFLQYLKNYTVVQSDATIVDQDLEFLHESYFKKKRVKAGFVTNLIKNNFMGCCMAFHRKVLKVALPFPKHIPMHDQWIGLIGELLFSTCFIPNKLILYRRHTANASETGSKSPFDIMRKFRFRINIIRYIPLLLQRNFFKS